MLAKTERPTPREIADAIPMTSEHLAVAAELGEVRAKLTEAEQELRAEIVKRHGDDDGRGIASVAAKLDAIATRHGGLRQKERTLRGERALRVRDALRPVRREAAARILDLLDEIQSQEDVLDQSYAAIDWHGSEVTRMPDWIASIKQRLSKIAATGI